MRSMSLRRSFCFVAPSSLNWFSCEINATASCDRLQSVALRPIVSRNWLASLIQPSHCPITPTSLLTPVPNPRYTHWIMLTCSLSLLYGKLLPLSFTPGLKPTPFTNPIPVVSLLPPGLPPRTIARTVSSSELRVFCFLFPPPPYLIVSGPCAKLSWPSRQLLSAR